MRIPTYPTAAFDFELPESSIAQSPSDRRDASRLMVVDRASGRITHRTFADLAEYVPAGDVLVRNTTRVIRARLLGTRDSGAPAEVMLLKPLGDHRWEAMIHPGGKLRPGRVVHVAPGFDVHIESVTERRTRIVRLACALDDSAAIEAHGHIPLPPYIHRADAGADVERYQTVYAREAGSVAAPTAGLHFTPELLARLTSQGVQLADVVLHVGAGTFKPVEVDDVTQHVMHEEWYRLDAATASQLNAARADGARLWAVGTTSVRTLESNVDAHGSFHASEGETSIFIYPPYTFRAVDHLVTNFHLPRSTLLMLVAAFAGHELIMDAYRTAVRDGYRFYSYGDAMVIL
ncbi:MAG: tRNA preQ1(34) S-adenosylmethionine ribosyltransferase-isomerase QueA [Gemmatimonadetes bacterium]|jgi:S-adenosylmethionine:tRNA ribosyltransferase-isomerase|nr:tRNA preQ1(34) S-adenosylmethionine ribosyltransferase-isomerase QueA [Gemmatimonadota bacterium]MBK7833381.1 tRNA preQ1(34) S-adenosylmethionine ribosyltransferase-isomerase QueA [Gemmatimonadota bacterium]MBK8061103.1 tRNA preQ1(34) S-adenosylmethionine ribosyltransferase-isomerase QueA [Gemmatimonadota bacterium]MBP9105792.1 tRNA preQ1(34) S-adenosylmethionine ribosyltransferase-isomerase QueA [Gemmatimonadaceae bacterium]